MSRGWWRSRGSIWEPTARWTWWAGPGWAWSPGAWPISWSASTRDLAMAGPADEAPRRREQRGGQQELQRVADHERVETELEPLLHRDVQGRHQPGDGCHVQDDLANEHD